ncbi:PaaI family thioesterase [Streptomyces physcomitrii]|uniref:PaaI family thioesterase n=1 Tax=Streptomyces physcomitrii TaxID=2724184 RepID=UPI0011AB5D49
MAAEGEEVSSSMPAGSWLCGPEGRPVLGGLGVLVDNVLGYALMLHRPRDRWSVSSEISIDLCRPLPAEDPLSARASVLTSDSRGAVSSGSVVDHRGRLLAVCRQHGRWVRTLPTARPPGSGATTTTIPAAPATGLLELLGAQVKADRDSAELDLLATAELVNPLGNLHGGVALCASDLAAQAALQAGDRSFGTSSVHIAYARPVPLGTAVRFVATVAHAGRSFAVVTVTALNELGKPCTLATVTAGTQG